jgi:hypothetical protein
LKEYEKVKYLHKSAKYKKDDIIMWKISNQTKKFAKQNIRLFTIDKINSNGIYYIVKKNNKHGIQLPANFLIPTALNDGEELYNKELDPKYFEIEDNEDEEFSEGVDDLDDNLYSLDQNGGFYPSDDYE